MQAVGCLHPARCSCTLTVKCVAQKELQTLFGKRFLRLLGTNWKIRGLTMVTVTDVRLSADKRAARVYVTVAGDEEEHKSALAALKHAAPYVRKQLGLSLNLPRTPEIHFVRDRVEEEGERVDQLLQEIEREWESKGKDEG